MRDKVGKIPKIESKQFALKEIKKIADDKRSHVLLLDCVKWLELKVKTISTIAVRGLRTKEI